MGGREMPEGETHQQARPRLVAARYWLLNELGRGGMGTVWLADDQLVGRQVAVKELRPPHGLAGGDLAAFRRRALQEATSAARIHHPNAVTLYDVLPATADDDAVYLIMELIEGPTLGQLIAGSGTLPDATTAAYGLQLLDVLEAAHDLGITHRDVKPANIMITSAGQAKLTDFGIAHIAGDARLTRSGVMGTQAYMAPELFESAPITPAADLWALGATLYHATEGHCPFDRDTTAATLRAILLDPIPAPRCSPALAAAISALLQRDPVQRATASQARAQLSQAASHAPPATATRPGGPSAAPPPPWEQAKTTVSPPGRPVPPPESPTIPGRKPSHPYLIAAVIGAVIIALAGGTAAGVLSAHSSASPHPPPRPTPSTSSIPALKPRAVLTEAGATDGIDSVAFSPDGTTLAVADLAANGNQHAWLWDAATGTKTATLNLQPHSPPVFSPDGKTLAVSDGDNNGDIDLLDVSSQKVTAAVADPGATATSGEPTGAAFGPDGKTLAFVDDQGNVYLTDIANNTTAPPMADPGGASVADSTEIQFSPNGTMLAVGDSGIGNVYVWDVVTRRLIATLTAPSTEGFGSPPLIPLHWFAFSPNSATLAVADGTGEVRLWDTAAHAWTTTIKDGTGVVNLVAFSPDGKTLAMSQSNSSVTNLWNIAAHTVVATLNEPNPNTAEIQALAFSPDGKTLATTDSIGQICLWNVAGYD
jgi:serine/threonine protein kinase